LQYRILTKWYCQSHFSAVFTEHHVANLLSLFCVSLTDFSGRRLAVFIEVFVDFSATRGINWESNSAISWPISLLHYSSGFLPFDNALSELLKAPLNEPKIEMSPIHNTRRIRLC
jgi:hypothetical protein